MDCKFLKHGLAISYDGSVKPCCAWSYDQTWSQTNHYSQVDLGKWHQIQPLKQALETLSQNEWPDHCVNCAVVEKQTRNDSIRGGGENSYSSYSADDITLEIRPGNVCNFACQTCWPEASSRVAQFHHRAGLIDIKNLNTQAIDNFDFLLPVTHRIKDVILLGGEPFYDKNCLKFLDWSSDNLTANITMFTNGSYVDWNWVNNYSGKITMVFSIDAVGRPAEYIRFGTVWQEVHANFVRAQQHPKIQLRVNITTSVYNYCYISDIIDLLVADWPSVVTFGTPRLTYLLERAIPMDQRSSAINKLEQSVIKIQNATIESGQKANAVNALNSIVHNLKTQSWDSAEHNKLCDFIKRMDLVKKINVADYCKDLQLMLDKQPVEIL
jgi:sulfatase maturation enzyme AslB (radical SAM superfamily)